MKAKIEYVPIGDVTFGERTRKHYGGLDSLAESLSRVGMLHPIITDSELTLIAGGRRYKAAESLGWSEVPVIRCKSLDDALLALEAERDENTCREPLTAIEMVEMGRRLEAVERPEAEAREKATQAKPGEKIGTSERMTRAKGGGKLPPPTKQAKTASNCTPVQGKTRDKVGKAVGKGARTYDKAKQVVEAAEADPEQYGDLPERMDAESIDAAHKEMKKRQTEANGKTKPVAVDSVGIPVQDHATEAFADRQHFDALLAKLRDCYADLRTLVDLPGGKLLIRQVQWEKSNNMDGGRWMFAHLDNAIRTIERCKPAVTDCPYAYNPDQPHGETCRVCFNLRWLGSLKSHQIPPNLMRAMLQHYGVKEGR